MSKAPCVAFVAPCGFVTDNDVLDRAAQLFAGKGWHVHAGDSCFERHERFAGTDELRAGELQAFCSDKRYDLIVCARGGYGMSRLLDRLDFDAIACAQRAIVGYSDFTAFNLAYLARAGGVSLHGPGASDFGASEPHAQTLSAFFSTLCNPAHTVCFETESVNLQCQGTLWGGNLALVCALIGTPYLPKVRGGILFLEDVNEPAYKIERMLLQLLQAGILQKQSAILLGAFEPVVSMPNDNGYSLSSVLSLMRAKLNVPILTGLPFGHVPYKVTLPIGAQATLKAQDGQAHLSWLDWRKNA